MPCFKGLAVSIHTPEGPLPEYSIQKQTRQSRITSYIPVPQPKTPHGSSRPEQSTFAISITLLVPGLGVPYSRPQPTPSDPNPSPKIVGGLPGTSSQRGKYSAAIAPYVPLSPSPYETIAAYIHFDGRAKEEVATLLRRGEETWVNSRWVSIPESEGGGLAEREFLFREVGLERWLNGLDLEGESKDVAARIERRKRRLEKRRRRRMEMQGSEDEDEDGLPGRARPLETNSVLRYKEDKQSSVGSLSGDEGMFSTESESEDEVPMPEAAGQIKVSLFRVLASGEIKRGEYSPQFDAHDDDEGMQAQNGSSSNHDADVDHTTTFAKPKTLDPKSISTQTVTGIDAPEKPYATFTFFYRGHKQLQKMGILPTPPPAEVKPTTAKRKSHQVDFASLTPLKPKDGTAGFIGYRDTAAAPVSPFDPVGRNGKKKNTDDMDSDGDEDYNRPGSIKAPSQDDTDEKEGEEKMLSPEETAKSAELAEGVKKMQLKRQHSFEPVATSSSTRKQATPYTPVESQPLFPPDQLDSNLSQPLFDPVTPATLFPGSTPRLGSAEPSESIGSPFKKQRASVVEGAGLNITGVTQLPGTIEGTATVKVEAPQDTRPVSAQPEPQIRNETGMTDAKVKQEKPEGDEQL